MFFRKKATIKFFIIGPDISVEDVKKAVDGLPIKIIKTNLSNVPNLIDTKIEVKK